MLAWVSDFGITSVDAERRQVTVLFTDMAGFTSFSERAGEESTFTLMRSLSDIMEDAVREHGGAVQGFTGDGILAVFGAPAAYEDAPLRACRAALAIQQKIKEAKPALAAEHGVEPQMRIGLNTGVAVVGAVQRGADAGVTVLGDTVNLASRLQGLAELDGTLMSEATHRLVQGMVEASFAGEHKIKGKAEPQKVYRLDGIRKGTTRFEAAATRGLSAFVGRERELDVLERALATARGSLSVIDIVAEPGIGKSRLLHEFRQRIGKDGTVVLSGSCSPDGQQTPFLPFIEVVRGSFRVSPGEAEEVVAQKLEMGLSALGLHSVRNLGLLLHLLGLESPSGALAGLDGVLVGLRTRELLRQLLEARCRLAPVILIIEDLHWIDSVSAELLDKIVGGEGEQRLLVITTRRPEYAPLWADRDVIATQQLEPLPSGDIRRLVQTQLGVHNSSDALAKQLAEKAEGNPLFAEEIVSFLAERGIIRTTAGGLEFDSKVVAAALPGSVQSLLTARVDRLAPKDRSLLQAAAVIGRRFDPQLLAAVVENAGDIDAELSAMRFLDLVRPEGRSGDYAFKHALTRDALYQSLLTARRTELHSRIAGEIERRSSNRLGEVAETLAHHYGQTDRADKAFVYLAMAGAKCLGVSSLEEAEAHLSSAIALLARNPECALDEDVSEAFANYSYLLNLLMRFNAIAELFTRFLDKWNAMPDSKTKATAHHHYVLALLWLGRYREAEREQQKLCSMAEALSDFQSTAYSLTSGIYLATTTAPLSLQEFLRQRDDAIAAADQTGDAYLRYFLRWVIGWEELNRGRMIEAARSSEELMDIGRRMNDPRSVGRGLMLQSWLALASDDYVRGLRTAEEGILSSQTPWDMDGSLAAQATALVLLRRPEGFPLLEKYISQCYAHGRIWHLSGPLTVRGLALILHGQIRQGIRVMQQRIRELDEGNAYRTAADWCAMFLAESYMEIVSGREKPPTSVVLLNLVTLVAVMVTAEKRILPLLDRIRLNPRFDPNGHHIGRCHLILGLFYKAKKKHALATKHLSEAKRIASQFGSTPALGRIESALAELDR